MNNKHENLNNITKSLRESAKVFVEHGNMSSAKAVNEIIKSIKEFIKEMDEIVSA